MSRRPISTIDFPPPLCYDVGMSRPVTEGGSLSVQKYGLRAISHRHREIARRVVMGDTPASICEAMDISTSRLSIIINSPLFKEECDKLKTQRDASAVDVRRELDEEFNGMQGQFNAVVASAMANDDIEVALKGAALWGKAAGKLGGSGVTVNIQNNNGASPVDLSKYRTPQGEAVHPVNSEDKAIDAEFYTKP